MFPGFPKVSTIENMNLHDWPISTFRSLQAMWGRIAGLQPRKELPGIVYNGEPPGGIVDVPIVLTPE